MDIFNQELFSAYESYVDGKAPSFEKLPIQYKDYAEFEQSDKNRKYLRNQEKYWLNTFKDNLPILDLPLDNIRPPIQTYKGDTRQIIIKKHI